MLNEYYLLTREPSALPRFTCRVPLEGSRQLFLVDGKIQETGKPFEFALPDGQTMDDLLQVIGIRTDASGNDIAFRNGFRFGSGSSGRILLCSHTFAPSPFHTEETTEIRLEENARAEITVMQNEHDRASHRTAFRIAQAAGSRLKLVFISLHGGLIANDIEVSLDGTGADCDLSGLYLADGRQEVTNRIRLTHRVPDCTSSQLFKGILNEEASGTFNGIIHVVPGAQHTDAFQANHNLLLSDTARIRTEPQLEIYADDVKCSHGATIGRLQPDELFYLRSRGIPEKEAGLLQQLAFAHAVLEKIPNETLRERMMVLVESRLRGNLSDCEGCTRNCC